MAKQRGIHQISGKINNLCYYEQKYVRGGLIRRINEAMSERLKSDPLFAKTRHANIIFGGCSMVSGALLSCFGSRNTYLFKPYRHALLTREVKKYLLDTGSGTDYPYILDRVRSFNDLPNIIDVIVKNKLSFSFPDVPRKVFDLAIDDTYDFVFTYNDLARFCSKNNCIGVQMTISAPFGVYHSSYNSSTKTYDKVTVAGGGRGTYFNWYLNEYDSDLTLSVGTGNIDDAVTFWIVYATPILSTNLGRPVTGETGAICGIVTFLAS